MSELGFREGRAFFPKRRSFKEANVLRSEKSPTSRVDADLKKQGQYFGHAIFCGGCCVNLPSPVTFQNPPQKMQMVVFLTVEMTPGRLKRPTPRCHPEMFPWQPSRSRMANAFRNVAGWDEKFFVFSATLLIGKPMVVGYHHFRKPHHF